MRLELLLNNGSTGTSTGSYRTVPTMSHSPAPCCRFVFFAKFTFATLLGKVNGSAIRHAGTRGFVAKSWLASNLPYCLYGTLPYAVTPERLLYCAAVHQASRLGSMGHRTGHGPRRSTGLSTTWEKEKSDRWLAALAAVRGWASRGGPSKDCPQKVKRDHARLACER